MQSLYLIKYSQVIFLVFVLLNLLTFEFETEFTSSVFYLNAQLLTFKMIA